MAIIQTYSPEYQDQIISLIQSIQQDEFLAPVRIKDQPDLIKIPEFYQIGKGIFGLLSTRMR